MGSIAIFDFDGTLTKSLWRKKFHTAGKFDEFHDLVESDFRNEKIFDKFLDALSDEKCIVKILTARPTKHIQSMIDWIREEMKDHADISCEKTSILCRGDDDHRPSREIKKENIKKLIAGVDKSIITIYEDRQDCVDMYLSLGLNAIKVEEE